MDRIANRKRTAVIQARVAYTENVGLGGSNAPVPRSVTPAGMSTYATAVPAASYPPVTYPIPIRITVPAPAPSITIQAGVIGNRFDTDRAVTKALRRHRRLNGERE